jgi:hypothetical protein
MYRMQVMHVTHRDRRSWVLGCRFERQLDADDLNIFAPTNDASASNEAADRPLT